MVVCAGKSRKNVDAYVLIPPDAKNALTVLNKTRNLVGVPAANPYIFCQNERTYSTKWQYRTC